MRLIKVNKLGDFCEMMFKDIFVESSILFWELIVSLELFVYFYSQVDNDGVCC